MALKCKSFTTTSSKLEPFSIDLLIFGVQAVTVHKYYGRIFQKITKKNSIICAICQRLKRDKLQFSRNWPSFR